jgi:8-oxo-dGTP pyrophosphatase MutT (NUDIX family)
MVHVNKLPYGPTHQVGVGAVIIHPKEKNKILVVQEKSGPASINQLWKMPTGLTDPGEDIPQALVREVYEETTYKVNFQQIICFRQAHSSGRSSGGSMGQSDLFFVCLATLTRTNNEDDNNYDEMLKDFHNQSHDEIANIQWMDVDEYANQKIWKLSPLYKEMNDAVRRCVYHYSSHSATQGKGGEADLTVDSRIQDEMDNKAEDHDSRQGKDDDGVAVVDPYGFIAKTLPIGFRPGVNTIYISKL